MRQGRTLRTLPLIFLAGCMVGPNYTRPHVPLPVEWSRSPVAEPVSTASASGTNLAQWWQGVRDPTLDSLIEAALAGDPHLTAGVARFPEAPAEPWLAAGGLYRSAAASGSYERTRPFSKHSQEGSFLPPDK